MDFILNKVHYFLYNLLMEIPETITSQQLIKIEKQFKSTEHLWKSARTGKEKSKYWLEMQELDARRSELLSKRQQEIELELNSQIELSDGSSVKKRIFMDLQRKYELNDEEMKNYIPLILED